MARKQYDIPKGPDRRARKAMRNLDDQMIGSHVSRSPERSSRSSSRTERAGRGSSRSSSSRTGRTGSHASQSLPMTSTMEPSRARARSHARGVGERSGFADAGTRTPRSHERTSKSAKRSSMMTRPDSPSSTIAENEQSKSRKRAMLIGIIVLAIVLVAALGAGIYTYFKTTNANLDLNPSNAADSLVAVSKDAGDDAFYMLCTADLDIPETRALEPESEGYMLVRVDEAQRILTFITVPCKLSARMSDGETHPLYEAQEIGGDAELVAAIAKLLDIDIAHFVSTNAEHIAAMVDLIGGIEVNLTEEIDDPRAGTEVLFAGEQVLSGKQAVLYLRATNLSGSFEATAANRVDFTMKLLEDALSSQGLDFASVVSDASLYIDTDLSAADLLAMADAARPLSEMTVYSCVLPYYESLNVETNEKVYALSKKSWAALFELVDEGGDPALVDNAAETVVPSEVTVEVRNGTQMAGAAAGLGEILTSFGYDVIGVGNVDDGTIYPETLIIYTNADAEGAAKAIIRDIGSGRVVNGGDFYSSTADVIAIIGADYMPVL